jgi:hypothetical protein
MLILNNELELLEAAGSDLPHPAACYCWRSSGETSSHSIIRPRRTVPGTHLLSEFSLSRMPHYGLIFLSHDSLVR